MNESHAPPSKKTALKKWLEATIDSNSVQIFLSITLFVTLFLPDIWVVSNTPNDHDFILNAVRARATPCARTEPRGAPLRWLQSANAPARADSSHIVRLLRDRNGMPVHCAT